MKDLGKRQSGRHSRRGFIEGVASVGAFAAVGAPYFARAAAGPILIGFPVPLTGPFGAEAKDQVKSAELAVKQFNDGGGCNGRMAELQVRDDKLSPGEAATRALELIEKDKCHFIVGALSSAVQLSVNDVTRARGVIYISISQSDSINEVKDFSRFTFHEAMNPQMTTGAVARQAFTKGQKVAYLAADYAYGHEMLAEFKLDGDAQAAEPAGFRSRHIRRSIPACHRRQKEDGTANVARISSCQSRSMFSVQNGNLGTRFSFPTRAETCDLGACKKRVTTFIRAFHDGCVRFEKRESPVLLPPVE